MEKFLGPFELQLDLDENLAEFLEANEIPAETQKYASQEPIVRVIEDNGDGSYNYKIVLPKHDNMTIQHTFRLGEPHEHNVWGFPVKSTLTLEDNDETLVDYAQKLDGSGDAFVSRITVSGDQSILLSQGRYATTLEPDLLAGWRKLALSKLKDDFMSANTSIFNIPSMMFLHTRATELIARNAAMEEQEEAIIVDSETAASPKATFSTTIQPAATLAKSTAANYHKTRYPLVVTAIPNISFEGNTATNGAANEHSDGDAEDKKEKPKSRRNNDDIISELVKEFIKEPTSKKENRKQSQSIPRIKVRIGDPCTLHSQCPEGGMCYKTRAATYKYCVCRHGRPRREGSYQYCPEGIRKMIEDPIPEETKPPNPTTVTMPPPRTMKYSWEGINPAPGIEFFREPGDPMFGSTTVRGMATRKFYYEGEEVPVSELWRLSASDRRKISSTTDTPEQGTSTPTATTPSKNSSSGQKPEKEMERMVAMMTMVRQLWKDVASDFSSTTPAATPFPTTFPARGGPDMMPSIPMFPFAIPAAVPGNSQNPEDGKAMWLMVPAQEDSHGRLILDPQQLGMFGNHYRNTKPPTTTSTTTTTTPTTTTTTTEEPTTRRRIRTTNEPYVDYPEEFFNPPNAMPTTKRTLQHLISEVQQLYLDGNKTPGASGRKTGTSVGSVYEDLNNVDGSHPPPWLGSLIPDHEPSGNSDDISDRQEALQLHSIISQLKTLIDKEERKLTTSPSRFISHQNTPPPMTAARLAQLLSKEQWSNRKGVDMSQFHRTPPPDGRLPDFPGILPDSTLTRDGRVATAAPGRMPSRERQPTRQTYGRGYGSQDRLEESRRNSGAAAKPNKFMEGARAILERLGIDPALVGDDAAVLAKLGENEMRNKRVRNGRLQTVATTARSRNPAAIQSPTKRTLQTLISDFRHMLGG